MVALSVETGFVLKSRYFLRTPSIPSIPMWNQFTVISRHWRQLSLQRCEANGWSDFKGRAIDASAKEPKDGEKPKCLFIYLDDDEDDGMTMCADGISFTFAHSAAAAVVAVFHPRPRDSATATIYSVPVCLCVPVCAFACTSVRAYDKSGDGVGSGSGGVAATAEMINRQTLVCAHTNQKDEGGKPTHTREREHASTHACLLGVHRN